MAGRARNNLTSSGFTLLEVVVAMALLAVGLLLASQNFSASFRGIRTSQEYMDATTLASNRMADLLLRDSLPPSRGRGQWAGFAWEEEVARTELIGAGLEASQVAMMKVRVKVFWGNRAVQLWTLKSAYRERSP